LSLWGVKENAQRCDAPGFFRLYFYCSGFGGIVGHAYHGQLLTTIAVHRELSIYVVQHPDAAGCLLHGQYELVLGERRSYRWYEAGNHQSRAIKFCDLERLADKLSCSWIEADAPDMTLKKPADPPSAIAGVLALLAKVIDEHDVAVRIVNL